jgi:AmmeMemoRadiSam system protein A
MAEKYSDFEKKLMLSLARKSIHHYLEHKKILAVDRKEIPKALLDEGACFVTLRIGKELRGCIGSLEAHRPLLDDLLHNAIASAFSDPRFPALRENEFHKIGISISVLTIPKPLKVKDSADLLKKLIIGKTGLIIRKGYSGATFLPAVWEEVPEKKDFLTHLCWKAGLPPNEWKNTADMQFFTYGAIEFSE